MLEPRVIKRRDQLENGCSWQNRSSDLRPHDSRFPLDLDLGPVPMFGRTSTATLELQYTIVTSHHDPGLSCSHHATLRIVVLTTHFDALLPRYISSVASSPPALWQVHLVRACPSEEEPNPARLPFAAACRRLLVKHACRCTH
jgi:hypothetical protein